MKSNHINYVELRAKDLGAVKDFYSKSFGWRFTDYGPDYVAFSDSGLDGGFEKSEKEIINGALVVLYHEDLEATKEKSLARTEKFRKISSPFRGEEDFISLILLVMN